MQAATDIENLELVTCCKCGSFGSLLEIRGTEVVICVDCIKTAQQPLRCASCQKADASRFYLGTWGDAYCSDCALEDE